MTSAAQIEQELAALKAQIAQKEKDLEEQKQAEIEALKAEREKGIRDAWAALTDEFIKAGMASRSTATSERG